jgi:hypothetical protein
LCVRKLFQIVCVGMPCGHSRCVRGRKTGDGYVPAKNAPPPADSECRPRCRRAEQLRDDHLHGVRAASFRQPRDRASSWRSGPRVEAGDGTICPESAPPPVARNLGESDLADSISARDAEASMSDGEGCRVRHRARQRVTPDHLAPAACRWGNGWKSRFPTDQISATDANGSRQI